MDIVVCCPRKAVKFNNSLTAYDHVVIAKSTDDDFAPIFCWHQGICSHHDCTGWSVHVGANGLPTSRPLPNIVCLIITRCVWSIWQGYHRECLNNPIFPNFGLCAACWAHFMWHHELWPTSVSHPFSSLNSSLATTGGIYYRKITIPIFRLILQNFAFPGCLSYILFYRYIFPLPFSGWVVIAVCDCFSPGN